MAFFNRINLTFIKRTNLLSRISCSKVCARNMILARNAGTRSIILESTKINRQIQQNSRGYLQNLSQKQKFRLYSTKTPFENETKIRLRMSQGRKGDPIVSHFCFDDPLADSLKILTHWGNGEKNPIVCDGDIVGNDSYTEHKAKFQRIIEKNCWTRRLREKEYIRLSLSKSKNTLLMCRIKNKDPEGFRGIQDFLNFCRKDTEMTRLEKNAFISSVFHDFLKKYKDLL